ncbi:hypothetical protein GHT06_019779 [Daphnia sinensis]|uniref:Uncharacterized protein n=1 Tax=Daphnia sinensis TaxID=1820382 RepID=A0AAD5PNX6_9CRUS|nr:hypothetical protein GHT06_019779 [Daphnia sinensis]
MFCTVIVILCGCFFDKIGRQKLRHPSFLTLLYRSPCVQILKRKKTANIEVFFFTFLEFLFFLTFPPHPSL